MNTFIKQVTHQPKEPVRIEREHNDVIVIEGVRYDGDYFREFGYPNTDILYSVQRDDEGVVRLTMIRTPEEAVQFFSEEQGAPAEDNDGL